MNYALKYPGEIQDCMQGQCSNPGKKIGTLYFGGKYPLYFYYCSRHTWIWDQLLEHKNRVLENKKRNASYWNKSVLKEKRR